MVLAGVLELVACWP
jgi:hypothetical protein